MTLIRLDKILVDSNSALTRRACDSDSTKMTRTHHCKICHALIYWGRHVKQCEAKPVCSAKMFAAPCVVRLIIFALLWSFLRSNHFCALYFYLRSSALHRAPPQTQCINQPVLLPTTCLSSMNNNKYCLPNICVFCKLHSHYCLLYDNGIFCTFCKFLTLCSITLVPLLPFFS